MKNLSLLLLVLAMACGVANAAIIDCGTGVYSFAQWSADFVGAGNGCAIGDKIFSNFSVGSIPTDTFLQFGQAGNLFTVNFIATPGGGFSKSFAESYQIAIDPTKPPASTGPTAIAAVAAGMQDSNGNGTATLVKTVTGDATGTASATDKNGTITPVVLTGISAQKLNVMDTFTYNSGTITNISNSFLQVSAPEPASMALIGCGLLALCFARRRRA